MTSLEKALRDFAQFAAKLKGDEKSEAQTFLFHLLAAFGHDPNTLPEGSTFEYRVRSPRPSDGTGIKGESQRTQFADFVWPGRCLIEMKSRGVKLSKHYQQTFDYWLNLVPHRPPYVVLCNFDEFWIYDFNTQLYEPVARATRRARAPCPRDPANTPIRRLPQSSSRPDSRRPANQLRGVAGGGGGGGVASLRP